MSKTIAALRLDFAQKLPPDMGSPYIMNTGVPPFVCVAFYPARVHELNDRNINGCEFILADYGNGGRAPGTLHGIAGIDEQNAQIVCCGLIAHGTSTRKLKPYTTTVFDMMCEAATNDTTPTPGDPK